MAVVHFKYPNNFPVCGNWCSSQSKTSVDPREVTCKSCMKTSIYKKEMQRIQALKKEEEPVDIMAVVIDSLLAIESPKHAYQVIEEREPHKHMVLNLDTEQIFEISVREMALVPKENSDG